MAKKIKKYFIFHAPWQILAITIFILSSLPGEDLPNLGFRAADKLIHMLIFGFLAVLILRSFENANSSFLFQNARFLAIGITVLYGALDEIHQYYVPGRSASVWDWFSDIAGAFILVFIFQFLRRRFLEYRES